MGLARLLAYKVRNASERAAEDFPVAAGPGAFNAFLRKLPEFKELLISYAGPLPSRNERSPKFDRFFKSLKKTVHKSVPADRYPANDRSCARRSILQYLKRLRQGSLYVDDGFEIEDATLASQMNEVFALQMGIGCSSMGTRWTRSSALKARTLTETRSSNYPKDLADSWLLRATEALLRLEAFVRHQLQRDRFQRGMRG